MRGRVVHDAVWVRTMTWHGMLYDGFIKAGRGSDVEVRGTRPVHRELCGRFRRGRETGSRGTSESRSKNLAGKPEAISSI